MHPEVEFVDFLDELLDRELDVVSPNALGGFLTSDRAKRMHAAVNCGGVIQVAEELVGCDLDRARERTSRVFDTTARVLERARNEGVTPVSAAEREAEDRIVAAT